MKELRCKDLKKGCRYVARGRTIRSIMKKIKKHARMKHEIERISAAMTRKARVAIHAV
jgi:predicted small metal-binding protein